MKKISLNEELLHQIRLMNFDKSKTLLEQTPPKKKVDGGGYSWSSNMQKTTPNASVSVDGKLIKNDKTDQKQKKSTNEIKLTDEDIQFAFDWVKKNVKKPENVDNANSFIESCSTKCVKPNDDKNLSRTFDLSNRACMACHKFIDPTGYFYNDKKPSEQEVQDFYIVVNKWNNFDSRRIEHNALMFGSLLLTLLSGGATAPLLLALGFDVADGFLYLEDDDPFMAGMSFFFGLLPGFQLAGPLLRSGMKELGLAYKEAKVMGGTLRTSKPFSKEAKIIKDALENDKLRREALVNGIRALVKIVFKEAKTVPILNIIFYLYEKGFLLGRFLTIFGLKCYGIFLTYEQIAKLMGIKEKEIKKKEEPNQIKDLYIDFSNNLKNKVLSSKDKTTFNDLTLLLQVALLSGGYEPLYVVESPFINWDNNKKTLIFNNSSNIKNVNILTSTGKLIKTYKNKIGSKTFSIPNILIDGVLILEIETYNNKKESIKFISNTSSQQTLTFGKKGLPNWGYYDEWTESAVRNFQKKNDLPFDGATGGQVGSKIKDLISKGSISTTKISSTLKFVDSDLSTLQSKNENNLTPEQSKPENLAKEIEAQKDTITDQIIDELTIPSNINVDSLINTYNDIERLKD